MCRTNVQNGVRERLDRFELRKTGIRSFEVRAYDDLAKRIPDADIVVVSGMWRNDLIACASKLKFIQSISSGMDQYSKEQLAAFGKNASKH